MSQLSSLFGNVTKKNLFFLLQAQYIFNCVYVNAVTSLSEINVLFHWTKYQLSLTWKSQYFTGIYVQ